MNRDAARRDDITGTVAVVAFYHAPVISLPDDASDATHPVCASQLLEDSVAMYCISGTAASAASVDDMSESDALFLSLLLQGERAESAQDRARRDAANAGMLMADFAYDFRDPGAAEAYASHVRGVAKTEVGRLRATSDCAGGTRRSYCEKVLSALRSDSTAKIKDTLQLWLRPPTDRPHIKVCPPQDVPTDEPVRVTLVLHIHGDAFAEEGAGLPGTRPSLTA